MKNILLYILVLFPMFGMADELDNANELFEAGYYKDALGIYNSSNELSQYEVIRKGLCHYYLKEYEKADYQITEIRKWNDSDSILFVAIDLKIIRGEYSLAKELLSEVNFSSTDEYKGYQNKLSWIQSNLEYKSKADIKKTDIDTKGPNFGIELTDDGMLTTIIIDGVYTLVYIDHYSSEVQTIEALRMEANRRYKGGTYIGNPALAGKNMFFTSNRSDYKYFTKGNRDNRYINDYGENKLAIMMGRATFGRIKDIEVFVHCNDQYDYLTPFFYEQKLYFAADLPGGFGGYDLYYCEKNENGSWSKPRNLGEKVNSYGDELFPFRIREKFFFSSTGREGFGGADIYYTKITESGFTTPQNMGSGVNSGSDDFSFKTEDPELQKCYLVSNRNNNLGIDNIYSVDNLMLSRTQKTEGIDIITKKNVGIDYVDLMYNVDTTRYNSPEDKFVEYETPISSDFTVSFKKIGYIEETVSGDLFIKDNAIDSILFTPNFSGIVKNRITGEPIEYAKVYATESGQLVIATKTDTSGRWYLAAPSGSDINIIVSADNFQSDTLESDEWVGNEIKSFLSPEVKEGTKIEIRNIYFEFGKADITEESFKILDNIYDYLTENPAVRIELSAHTDSRGSKRANQSLSQRRAQSAFNYLVEKGISKERLVAKGYGESKLTNQCLDGVECSEEEHQANRRVELIVL